MMLRQYFKKLIARKEAIEPSVFYYQNGTSSTGFSPIERLSHSFFIEKLACSLNQTIYPGSFVLQEIEDELQSLQYSFRRKLYPSDEQYYKENSILPILINEAGMSSDSSVSKEEMVQILSRLGNTENYNRHMYLADVTYLINSITNLIIGLEANMVDVFRLLTETRLPRVGRDGTFVVYGQHSENTISALGSYYIKLYSILDLLTKVAYEFEHPCVQFDKYPRLNSRSVLYNNKHRLCLDETPDTLFAKDNSLLEIETIRNEIVHNGMWENGARIFVTMNQGDCVERFILYPDMQEGRFVAHGNRHHFFSAGTKVNDVLPYVHMTFLSRLRNSINCIYRQKA